MIDYAALIDWIAMAVPFLVLAGFVWAPKTWTPGELVTAAAMNTNIRDHLNETLRSQTTTSTGTVNNFALDGPFAYVKCNNASGLILTGALIDSGNIDGARVIIEAINSSVTLKHQDSGSSSANRFTNDSGSDIVLALNERAFLFYDTANTTWRVGKASTGPIAQSVGAVNFFPDPYFIIWPDGDSSAPAEATLTKDGNSALSRNTTTYLYAGMAPQLKLGTTATVSTKLTWTIFSSLPVSWRGKTIGIGCSIRSPTSTANLGQLEVADGGTGGTTKSAFQSGANAWEWISFTHKFTNNATKLEVSLVADIGGQDTSEVSVLFDGMTLTLGKLAPEDFKPTPSTEGLVYFGEIKGTISTGVDKFRFDARRPFIVRRVDLRCKTAPTGAALIVDTNQWDGAGWTSMFSTRPQIAAGTKAGGAAPDGTYRYRCFRGRKGTDGFAGAWLDVDIDQVGSTEAGADLQIAVAVLQFQDHYAALK